MNEHFPYHRIPCENASPVSYRPIEKVSIYSFDDLCKAFADKHTVNLEGLKGTITSLKRLCNTPSDSVIVTVQSGEYISCLTVRIK
jgi:hypothetical protein